MNEEIQEKLNAICYTDGSAWPSSRGFYGGGIHGYLYKDSDIADKTKDRPTQFFITTDGYIEKENIDKHPDSKHVNPCMYMNGAYSHTGEGTNNQGELTGVIRTLELLMEKEIDLKTAIIYTDSNYTIGLVNAFIDTLTPDFLTDMQKPNRELILELQSIMEVVLGKGIEIEVRWVKGHSTNLGNHLSDRMAFLGRYKSTKGIAENVLHIIDSKNYWKVTVEKDPMVNFRQLFFTRESRGISDKYSYVVMDYKKDVELGRKSNTSTFGIVIKNEPIELIENMIKIYHDNLRTMSLLSSVNLKELYSQHNLTYHELFGNDIYTFFKKKGILSVMEENIVVNAINPPGLANQAMTKTLTLYDIINSYNSHKLDNTGETAFRTFHDITDYVYETNDKGKTVIKIDMIDKVIEVPVKIADKDITIPLYLETDALNRNSLKKLEKLKPKITLVVDQQSEQHIEYYTIIETEENGDIGVYCNFYSNKVFFPKKKKEKKKK